MSKQEQNFSYNWEFLKKTWDQMQFFLKSDLHQFYKANSELRWNFNLEDSLIDSDKAIDDLTR